MPPSFHNRLPAGFTLLEVLIALALLGMLAGGLYGTYFSLLKGRESAVAGMEARRELRTTLDLLRREINSALYSDLYSRNNKKLHFTVEDKDIFGRPASVLAFTAIAPPQPGGQAISDQIDLKYEILERDKKMILSRQIKDISHSPDPGRYPQMESIEGFLVECLNGNKWVKSWDAVTNLGLPKLVRITVTVKDGEKTADYSVLAAPKMIP